MTYFGLQPAKARLELAMFSWVNKASHSVGQPFDLTQHATTWSPAPVIASGDSLALPAGEYFAQAFSNITRSSSTQNIQYAWFVDGVEVGMRGQSDFYVSKNQDVADAVFGVPEGQTATLELRLVALSGSMPTVTANSCIVVWRSDIATPSEATL